MTTSTLVCDPDGHLTAELRRFLSDFGFYIVGVARSIRAAIGSADKEPVPELVLFDFDAAFAGDPGAIQSLRRQFPSAKLVGFHDGAVGEDHLVTGLSAGLDGYIMKNTPAPSLVLSLVAVMADGVVLSQPMASLLRGDGTSGFERELEKQDAEFPRLLADGPWTIDRDADLPASDGGSQSAWPPVPIEGRPAALSEREQDVLVCLLRGDSNKAIAKTLDIKESTVKSHIKAVMRKINVSKRNQVILWAIQHGIVGARDDGQPGHADADRARHTH